MTARLIGRIAAQPWAIHDGALETILDIAARETLDETVLAEWKQHMAPAALRSKPTQPLPNSSRAEMRDGVAILQVSGPIFRYANIFTEMSGAASLATFSRDLDAAASDTRVRSILLEIDSPGGEVTGMIEAAAQIRAVNASKPVVAFIEGLGASAAYQLAAAASEIVVSPTAMLGCLGVVAVLNDTSARDARSGVKRHEFVSSQTPGKRPDPGTDTGRAAIQTTIDALGAAFLDDVAGHRAMSVDELLAATKGGGLVVGAEAVRTGLADRVGTFEATMARLSAGAVPMLRKPTPAPRASTEELMPMSDPVLAPVAVAPDTVAPAPVPVAIDLVAQERARCGAIQTAAKPEFAALAALAVSGGWSVEQFTAAQDASGGAVASAVQAVEARTFRASLPAPVGASPPADKPAVGPEAWASEFAASDALQAEFKTSGAYVGFRTAEAAGKVRILGRKG